MIRLRNPEGAEGTPRDGDILPFRRRRNRVFGGQQRDERGGEIADLRRQVNDLGGRVQDLEADRRTLRKQVRKLKAGGAPVTDEAAGQPVATPEQPAVEGPKTLAQLKHLLIQIESKQRDEHTSPAVTADLDAMFEKLAATALGQTDFSETRPVAEQLDHLDQLEESNASHNPKRRAAIAAARNQLRPHLPLRSVELTTAVEELKSLKAREDLLLESKPLPKFDSALERQINAAYTTLERTAFSCTPNEASAIRAQMRLLFTSENKRFDFKFGSNRWFTSYSDEEKSAQRLYDGRRNMYHTRQKQIQNIIEKLDKITNSTSMFWRMLGRGNEHLAA